MPWLNSQTLRALGVAVVGLVATVGSIFFGANAATVTQNGTALVESLIPVSIAFGGIVYAIWARVTKPNPPITQAAADAHAAIIAAGGPPSQADINTQAAAAAPPTTVLKPRSSSSTMKAHWAVSVLVLIVIGVMLQACTLFQAEPVAAASTVGQKAAALLGDYNIYAAASISIGNNPAVAVSARREVLNAVLVSKPIADSAQQALMEYRQVNAQLVNGTTTADKLQIAAANLTTWTVQLTGLVNNLIAAEKGATTP